MFLVVFDSRFGIMKTGCLRVHLASLQVGISCCSDRVKYSQLPVMSKYAINERKIYLLLPLH